MGSIKILFGRNRTAKTLAINAQDSAASRGIVRRGKFKYRWINRIWREGPGRPIGRGAKMQRAGQLLGAEESAAGGEKLVVHEGGQADGTGQDKAEDALHQFAAGRSV